MANILLYENNIVKDYLQSVNTGEFVLDPNAKKYELQPKSGVLINPDLSALQSVDRKYWKVERGQVLEMNSQEKKAVDDAQKAKEDEAKNNLDSLDIKTLANALIKKGLITKKEIHG